MPAGPVHSHVVVTGGSSGIGLAVAEAFARRGSRVSLLARDVSRLEAAARGLRSEGAAVGFRAADVADADACREAIGQLCAEGGACDVLVASAGVTEPGRFLEQDPDVFRRLMDVDYFGTVNSVRAVAADMVRRRSGSIVGISSAAAFAGVYGYSAYGAAKFAVRGFLEALRMELAPHGVHVACCFPPDVATPMLAYEEPLKPPETAALAGTIRPLPPEKVADCIVAGVLHRRFELIPDFRTRLFARLAGTAPSLLHRITDRIVRRGIIGKSRRLR